MPAARAATVCAEAGCPRVATRHCRHTFASLAIAAGANAIAQSGWLVGLSRGTQDRMAQ